MSDQVAKSRTRVLDPIDRASEILFGLIMALTFTCSLSVAEAGQAEVKTMLLGAIGCNLAWGVIDAMFYLMGQLAEQGRGIRTLRAVYETDPQTGQQLIADAMPSVIASTMQPSELESIRQRLIAQPEPPASAHLTAKDRWGAVAVCLLVFFSTFPLVIPFLLTSNVLLALRLSNGVATVLLFIAGYQLALAAGRRPWVMGISMVIVGALMVSLCIALGG